MQWRWKVWPSWGVEQLLAQWWPVWQCMKWSVTRSPNSTWFWLELVGNCCERLKMIMKYTNIQFCERLGSWLAVSSTGLVFSCTVIKKRTHNHSLDLAVLIHMAWYSLVYIGSDNEWLVRCQPDTVVTYRQRGPLLRNLVKFELKCNNVKKSASEDVVC